MTQITDDAGIPIFGANADHEGTVPFAVEVFDRKTKTPNLEYFEANADLGAGIFMSFMRMSNGKEEGRVIGAVQLLTNVTCDSDGLPSTYEQDHRAETESALAEWIGDGNAEADFAGIDEDERLQDIEQWSSRRRFMYYADSADHHIALSAIIELAGWLARTLTNLRPTQAGTTQNAGRSSKASPAGQKRTPRGSGGSRSKKA